MSAAFYNRKPANACGADELRKLYWGVSPEKTADRQQRQVEKQLQEGEQVVKQINRYNWTIQHIKGLTEHARLQTMVLDKPVEILVYKDVCESGLRPHLDICIPAGQEVQLTIGMLENLNEVVAEARRILRGESSTGYFNPNSLPNRPVF